MQAIEAAVHRWDAENAVGAARPLDAAIAADAVGQTFEVMAPMRRTVERRRQGTASGSCSSALTGRAGGWCSSTATLSRSVRLTVITTFKSQAPPLT